MLSSIPSHIHACHQTRDFALSPFVQAKLPEHDLSSTTRLNILLQSRDRSTLPGHILACATGALRIRRLRVSGGLHSCFMAIAHPQDRPQIYLHNKAKLFNLHDLIAQAGRNHLLEICTGFFD